MEGCYQFFVHPTSTSGLSPSLWHLSPNKQDQSKKLSNELAQSDIEEWCLYSSSKDKKEFLKMCYLCDFVINMLQ